MTEGMDESGRGHGYVVFARLCDIIGMAADDLDPLVRAFDEAVGEAVGVGEAKARQEGVTAPIVIRRLESPYGGAVVVLDRVGVALDIAEHLLEAAASRGVRLAIGLHEGPVLDTWDVVKHNLAGSAINYAARLAGLLQAEGTAVASVELVKEAGRARSRTRGRFGAVEHDKVKDTPLAFRRFDTRQEVSAAPPPSGSAVKMHAVVYDIVAYSARSDAAQLAALEVLTKAVERARTDLALDLSACRTGRRTG